MDSDEDSESSGDIASQGLTLLRTLSSHKAASASTSLGVPLAALNRWIANIGSQFRDLQRNLKTTKDALIKQSRTSAQLQAAAENVSGVLDSWLKCLFHRG